MINAYMAIHRGRQGMRIQDSNWVSETESPIQSSLSHLTEWMHGMRGGDIIQTYNPTFTNYLFNRKSHFGHPNTVCDRISKEAVRELKLKEEPNYAISHINQYRCRESELLSRLQRRQGPGVHQAFSQWQETDISGAGPRESCRIDEVIGILNRSPER